MCQDTKEKFNSDPKRHHFNVSYCPLYLLIISTSFFLIFQLQFVACFLSHTASTFPYVSG